MNVFDSSPATALGRTASNAPSFGGLQGFRSEFFGVSSRLPSLLTAERPARLPDSVVLANFDTEAHAPEHVVLRNKALAEKIAAVLGVPYCPVLTPSASPFYVTSKQLIGVPWNVDLHSINFLGGVVPCPHQAEKSIMHGLVSKGAERPFGWSEELAETMVGEQIGLVGYSAFTAEDALKAFQKLKDLGLNTVRVKDPTCTNCEGQVVVSSEEDLMEALSSLSFTGKAPSAARKFLTYGVVLEENLLAEGCQTYSLGRTQIGPHIIDYVGKQRFVDIERNGSLVKKYAGSDLLIKRHGPCSPTFAPNLLLQTGFADVTGIAKMMRKMQIFYDCIRQEPGVLITGLNVDGISGRRDTKVTKPEVSVGLLEQSFRTGGATPAEVWGLQALLKRPEAAFVLASTYTEYGEPLPELEPGRELLTSHRDESGAIRHSVQIRKTFYA